MELEGSDLPRLMAETLGNVVLDLLAEYVPSDRHGQKIRNEIQVLMVGLGNFAAYRNREDLRPLLYELSDKTGGTARV